MRKSVFALVAFAALFMAPSQADASPQIVTQNPATYGQGLADAMALSGVRALREAYASMFGPGVSMPADVEAALLVYERAIAGSPAQIARVIEVVSLSGVVQSVYLYHYFGGTNWMYTRLDFHSIGDGNWGLASLSFADQWSTIVLATTPGFRSTAPQR